MIECPRYDSAESRPSVLRPGCRARMECGTIYGAGACECEYEPGAQGRCAHCGGVA